jgi:hypothetical protein
MPWELGKERVHRTPQNYGDPRPLAVNISSKAVIQHIEAL